MSEKMHTLDMQSYEAGLDTAAAQVAALKADIADADFWLQLYRRHELEPNLPDCQCPVCHVHTRMRKKLRELGDACRAYLRAEAHNCEEHQTLLGGCSACDALKKLTDAIPKEL